MFSGKEQRISKCDSERVGCSMHVDSNFDIIMTKWVAVNGTAILAKKYFDALADKLPVSILERASNYSNNVDTEKEQRIANCYNAIVYTVSEGGIFKALWDMSEAASTGIEINLKHIYIKQETIEICEILDINPYMLNGEGSLLIITEHGNRLIRDLVNNGVDASIIGFTTQSKDRVVVNQEDDRRYLGPRIKDELLKLV